MSFDLRPYQCNKDLLHSAILDGGSIYKNGKYTCPDPNHEDKHPSTSLFQSDDGAWRFKCHACGATGDYFDVLSLRDGRAVEDIIRDHRDQAAPPPTPTKTAPKEKEKRPFDSIEDCIACAERTVGGHCTRQDRYHNPDTRECELAVLRIDQGQGKKQFWPCHPKDGKWWLGYAEGPRPLFNRGRIAGAKRVVVVEGEKCVVALAALGIVATTSPGGGNAATHCDWSPLAGKTVVIWPDPDEAGKKYVTQVKEQLLALDPPPQLQLIKPSNLKLSGKQDVFDFIEREREAGADNYVLVDMIEEALDWAAPLGGSIDLHNLIEAIIEERHVSLEWPHELTSQLTNALRPGTVTLLCGDPGSAKSFFLLQCLIWWHWQTKTRVAAMELENDRAFHLQRALVQLSEDNKNFTEEWIRAHPKQARENYQQWKPVLDTFADCIYDDPDVEQTLITLADWVADRCQERQRIIAIDPITIADPGGEPWVTERLFMVRCKRALRASGSSLILVTHPKKNRQNTISMDQLAGSSAYPRFSDTILWLEHHHNTKESNLLNFADTFGGRQEYVEENVKHNKTLHLCKCRNGRGHGMRIAMRLVGESMCMVEKGLIDTRPKTNSRN